MTRYEKTINSLMKIRDKFSIGSVEWDEIDNGLQLVTAIMAENKALQKAYNEKKEMLEIHEWAFEGLRQAYENREEKEL
ncbi:hypothetical protein [Clostridium perfringens]|uniref:Uncharacterized protein n=2 Tax=Clostridium perfringens TaxID=1502 RepID=A0AAP6WP85_CLOPF|nr:hypothetical protein [Clostridium perfringens]NP_612866.1 Gp37 protein [Clostridium phage phi3626]AAL96807.1 Gp37 protein [Clostridium phage phi3626]EDT22878.1 conserved domain protein [Clostridium perfringens B str. ATCC 3626]NGU30627.1 hypothetical protein [Clostridium perfringens]WEV05040.1 hypothetical protein PL322_13810 [Clostridium perfringens B]